MFKPTDKYKVVSSENVQQHLEKELKFILDSLLNPKYLEAIKKVEEICSKQNYLYN